MKKNYQIPSMKMVQIYSENIFCAGSVTNVDGGDDTGIGYGGGGSDPAHARGFDGGFWDDEDDWDE
mgnify:CR=1 FL=1